MARIEERRQVEAMQRHLDRLGLAWREAPGGRSLVAKLPVGSEPFPSAQRPFSVTHVVFATVGSSRIKCLTPRPLFFLPLVAIGDCATREAVEGRVREAWREREAELRAGRAWLEKIGAAPDPAGFEPVVGFGLGLDDAEARGRLVERGRVILPARGTLSGMPLRRAEDRLFRPDPSVASRSDLELAVASRLEELVRLEERLERQERLHAQRAEPPRVLPARDRHHRVLLVGRHLGGANGIAHRLRVRGCGVESARTASEALRAFERASFDLVLTDADLGRYEGIELIPSLRALPGVEEVPLVLVDDRVRPERRETARRLGAAGYLSHPLDLDRVQPGLLRLVETPRRRRWTRYAQRLAVRAQASEEAELTTQVGRGGMLLLCERDVPAHALERYVVALPHGAGELRVEGEIMYRLRASTLQQPAVGIRFHAFDEADEARWIAFLRSLGEAE